MRQKKILLAKGIIAGTCVDVFSSVLICLILFHDLIYVLSNKEEQDATRILACPSHQGWCGSQVKTTAGTDLPQNRNQKLMTATANSGCFKIKEYSVLQFAFRPLQSCDVMCVLTCVFFFFVLSELLLSLRVT